MKIRSLVRSNVRSLTAYQAKDIPCRIKLDANESPFGPAGRDLARIKKRLGELALNRYPDPELRELRKLLARKYRVKAGRLLFGNGSDELISMLITTFGGPVLYPVPTFSMYGIIAKGLGQKVLEVRLDNKFDIDVERMLGAVKKHKPKLAFLSTPNNPTGNCYSKEHVTEIIKESPGIVVVDEAYLDFSGQGSFLPMLKRYPNLVVMKTLSKVGLAALRLGILIASEEIVSEVNKVRLPFNINSLSQACAMEVLGNAGLMNRWTGSIARERDRLMGDMASIRGVRVLPSEANFILFKVNDPGGVYRKLLKRGILVRNLNGVVRGALRVTVGSPDENTAFLDALQAVMK